MLTTLTDLYQQPLHPVFPHPLLPPEGVYVPGPRAQYGVPAQGKECFSTGRASSARDQSRSPPILEDYHAVQYMYGCTLCGAAPEMDFPGLNC
jgi:hypothetical protein